MTRAARGLPPGETGGQAAAEGAAPAGGAAGESAGLIGRTAIGAATGAGIGGLYGASGTPDLTNAAQTLKDASGGAWAEAAFGGAGGAAGAAIGKVAGLGKVPVNPNTPTLENIEALKIGAYKQADNLGAAYTSQAYGDLVEKIAADAKASNISKDVHPYASAAIKNLQEDAANATKTNTPITLTQLDQKRKMVNRDVSSSPKAGEVFFGSQI